MPGFRRAAARLELRLPLGCRLERDVCTMSGLEANDAGYVILLGRGLPRIDVIGLADRVSWSTLVGQLTGIMESGEVEIR